MDCHHDWGSLFLSPVIKKFIIINVCRWALPKLRSGQSISMVNAPTLVAMGRLPSNPDGLSAANSHAREISMISGVPFHPFVLKCNHPRV